MPLILFCLFMTCIILITANGDPDTTVHVKSPGSTITCDYGDHTETFRDEATC